MKKWASNFKKLCTPAKIYFSIALITVVFWLFKGLPILFAVGKLFFASLWTFVLNWLCKKGFSGVSWALVLFPYIIIAIAFIVINSEKRQPTKQTNQQQNNAPYSKCNQH